MVPVDTNGVKVLYGVNPRKGMRLHDLYHTMSNAVVCRDETELRTAAQRGHPRVVRGPVHVLRVLPALRNAAPDDGNRAGRTRSTTGLIAVDKGPSPCTCH
ncbi:hypothetical protein DIPPA_16371 [Diplonema papillatum]|nr:hypothetical protein DIPPA_16371 [Diplonema papillatum]